MPGVWGGTHGEGDAAGVGLVVARLENVLAEILKGVEEAALERQRNLLVCRSERERKKRRWGIGTGRREEGRRLTGPVQLDSDLAAQDGLVGGVAAVQLAHHQLVGEVLREVDHAPDLAVLGGSQGVLVVGVGYLHDGGVVYVPQVAAAEHGVGAGGGVDAALARVQLVVDDGQFQEGRIAADSQTE